MKVKVGSRSATCLVVGRLLPVAVITAGVLFGIGGNAHAQTPSHLQGPNLGTWTAGPIELQLRASGGATPNVYTWTLLSGTLPPGISLRSDVPSFFPADADAGLIGVATTPGTFTFTLRVNSGGQIADRAYTWKITALSIKDQQLPDAFVGKFYSYQFTPIGNQGP